MRCKLITVVVFDSRTIKQGKEEQASEINQKRKGKPWFFEGMYASRSYKSAITLTLNRRKREKPSIIFSLVARAYTVCR